jgi:cytochrome c biogenesis protein CcdA
MSTVALAFMAGVSGSVGPCAAPRYLAVVGLAGSSPARSRFRILLAFALGVTCASVLLVESSAIVFATLAWSGALYVALGLVCLVAGGWTLLFGGERSCAHDASCVASSGASFAVGAACALVPSACCTPFLIGIGTMGATATVTANAAAAAAFALGHLGALAIVVAGSSPLMRLLANARVHEAWQTVGAGLSLALAAYYAVLA